MLKKINGITRYVAAASIAALIAGSLAAYAQVSGNWEVQGSVAAIGGLRVGSASQAGVVTLSNIKQISVSNTPVATAAAIGTTQQTFTYTGLAAGDVVYVQGPVPTSLCPMTNARVSAANTLQIDFTTLTAVACTPAAGAYVATVFK